jgi:hypothetical protein
MDRSEFDEIAKFVFHEHPQPCGIREIVDAIEFCGLPIVARMQNEALNRLRDEAVNPGIRINEFRANLYAIGLYLQYRGVLPFKKRRHY